MGSHIYDSFIYNEEKYLLLEIQHRLKQQIDWIKTTSEGLNYSFISCGLIPDIACKTLLKMTFEKGKLVLIQDLSLGNRIARHMEIQRQQSEGLKGLIEGVEPIGLLPPTDNL